MHDVASVSGLQRLNLQSFFSGFVRIDENVFAGHAYFPNDPAERVAVEIFVDGQSVMLLRAEQYEQALIQKGYGDGCYAFTYVAKPAQLKSRRFVEARIANFHVPIGSAVDLALDPILPMAGSAGSVEWVGGIRLVGRVHHRSMTDRLAVQVYDGDRIVATCMPRIWDGESSAVLMQHFSCHLPVGYADGKPHVFSVRDADGRELDGSPLTILAYPEGLREHVQQTTAHHRESLRAGWFDRFLPMSVPFADYVSWRDRFCTMVEHFPARMPRVKIVLIGHQDAEAAVDRLAEQTTDRWSAVVVPSDDGINFSWSDLTSALSAEPADEDIVVFTSARSVLRADAIVAFGEALAKHADSPAAYVDLEVETADGKLQPVFFGAFDYERLIEQGYPAYCFAVRANRVRIPDERGSGSLVRLFLALFDAAASENHQTILHIPGVFARCQSADLLAPRNALKHAVIAHLRQRAMPADVEHSESELFPAVRVKRHHTQGCLVSIIIPTRDKVELLAACIESIHTHTRNTPYEIIVVDNDSVSGAALGYFEKLREQGHKVISAPGGFNYSRLNNIGVGAARGDFVCLLNNDTEVVTSDWLEELLSRISEPNVGAVAPLLVWPNGMVQHGGVVLGPNFAVSDAFNDCMDGDSGHGDLLRVAHESSAVTAACLLTWRHDYLALSGFDEARFPVLFNDVDYCLRLRAAGKRVLFTPHAKLVHHESASRQQDLSFSQQSRKRRELGNLRSRWAEVIASDPTYSPFLNIDPYPFSALAWPARDSLPRLNRLPRPAG